MQRTVLVKSAHPAVPINIAGNTTPQQKLLLRELFDELALDAARVAEERLDEQAAQHILEARPKIKNELIESLTGIFSRHAFSDRHREEELNSNRAYPPNYHVRPVEAQVTALRSHFPQLGDCLEKLARRRLPDDAEAWFAIPRWQSLASSYGEATRKVLDALAKQRRFSNRLAGKLDQAYLRQTTRAERAWDIAAEQQAGNDILVIAAQAGCLHRGRSARRTRTVLRGNEFGLGAFAMGCILLTHPERLCSMDALMIDCCGDEYSLCADGVFNRVPLFDYDLGGLQFSVFYEDRARELWGSPTGFLIQTL